MSEPTQRRHVPGLDVDWDAAGRLAGRLVAPGPTGSRGALVHAVEELRDAAERARPLAMRASRLGPSIEAAGTGDVAARVLVVDRPGWARAAAQSFSGLLGDVGTQPAGRRVPTGATAQTASLIGLLAGRVLGQFDPFGASDPGGRLLLVAPNVLHVERALSADPVDFRLWVCVHEQTHALQFAAAPWLADHLRGEVAALAQDLAGTETLGDVLAAANRGVRAWREGRLGEDWSVLDLALDAEHRDRVERITAVMALLEGHADVTMDAVGRRAIPSLKRLRARMTARRGRARGVERLVRRLVGMDAKLAQYANGARFVRGVRRSGGRFALDPAWQDPAALPTPRELADPSAWVRRVHG
ncbi:zinc-dependent metalloprotease [Actinotalea sp. Marseille-Q4924]|uniref:zinc-dependent metalloprotease n=1 Tax=Actinotalea sp. Marseille-Q4924 TaxID=2866571 RepID=UPI001CE4A875|nr:zinc-dependent metalloprotease [Actinotalea sp. Marseille-Q4924]